MAAARERERGESGGNKVISWVLSTKFSTEERAEATTSQPLSLLSRSIPDLYAKHTSQCYTRSQPWRKCLATCTRRKKVKGRKMIFLCNLWMEINLPYLI